MELRNKRKHGFEKISRAFAGQARPKKVDEAFWKYKAVKHWDEAAAGFFEEAKEFTRAVDFKNGTLTVASLSRELALKLKMLAEKIIEALNNILGRRVVFKLVIED